MASWYNEMPKHARVIASDSAFLLDTSETGSSSKLKEAKMKATENKQQGKLKFTIDEHFKKQSCVVCHRPLPSPNPNGTPSSPLLCAYN